MGIHSDDSGKDWIQEDFEGSDQGMDDPQRAEEKYTGYLPGHRLLMGMKKAPVISRGKILEGNQDIFVSILSRRETKSQ